MNFEYFFFVLNIIYLMVTLYNKTMAELSTHKFLENLIVNSYTPAHTGSSTLFIGYNIMKQVWY